MNIYCGTFLHFLAKQTDAESFKNRYLLKRLILVSANQYIILPNQLINKKQLERNMFDENLFGIKSILLINLFEKNSGVTKQ